MSAGGGARGDRRRQRDGERGRLEAEAQRVHAVVGVARERPLAEQILSAQVGPEAPERRVARGGGELLRRGLVGGLRSRLRLPLDGAVRELLHALRSDADHWSVC